MASRRAKQLLYWVLLLCPAWQVFGQYHPPIRLFNQELLGPKPQVWDMAQASDGSMGFATGNGLVLFDGVNWRLIPVPGGQTLRAVAYDSTRKAWLAGAYHQWLSLNENENALLSQKPSSQRREEWWQAIGDPTRPGEVYWQTFSQLFRQNPDGKAQPIKLPGTLQLVHCIRDTLFVPLIEEGLHFVSGDTVWPDPGAESAKNLQIIGLAQGAQPGQILIATRDQGLFLLTSGKLSPWGKDLQVKGAQAVALNGMLGLKDGSVALATVRDGVWILAPDASLRYKIDEQLGLPDNSIISLFEDRASNLWVSTEQGLALIPTASALRLAALDRGSITDFCFQGCDPPLLSSNRGLYEYLPDGSTRAITEVETFVWHLASGSGATVVGTNSGTYMLDASRSLRKIGSQPGGWAWIQITENLAYAGTYNGLERYEKSPGQSWQSSGKIPGYNGPISQLQVDPHCPDWLWAVHPQEGLYLLKVGESSLDLQRPAWAETAGIGTLLPPAEAQPELQYANAEGLWTFSSEGFTRKPGSAGLRYPLPGKDMALGLFADRLVLYFRDSADSLTYRVRPKMDRPAVELLSENEVAVALEPGLALIDLSVSSHAESKIPVEVSLRRIGNLWECRLAQPRYSEIPLFKVWLEGVESEPSQWSPQGSYSYSVLPQGAYILRWKSDDGQQGQLSWTVPPRWYQTAWAYAIYISLLVLAFFGVRSYYRQRLQRQQRLSDLERERQLQAERLRARAAALESEVELSNRQIALSKLELQVRENDLASRTKELARSTLELARQNEALLQIREAIEPLPKSGDLGKMKRQLSRIIEEQLGDEGDWAYFHEHFNVVHAGFLQRLHQDYPDLSPGDLRLAALLRMNLPSKEIAPLLHLSLRGVENKRYRLRRKLQLGSEVNLTDWIMSY